MKKFIGKNFLLETKTARKLFEAVKDLPIIDWHCRLNTQKIAENAAFDNLAELWLGSDQHKWRAMRACGIDEEYITGDADDYEKFERFAETLENCIGNPLYHHTHLELKRIFECETELSSKTVNQVWEHCSAVLEDGLRVSDIFEKFNVEMICTSDSPLSSLEDHNKINNGEHPATVKPTFCPNELLAIENPDWAVYIEQLSALTEVDITDYESLKEAVLSRIDFFAENGCSMSDHEIIPFVYISEDDKILDIIIRKALSRETLSFEESCAFKTEMLVDLGKKYAMLDWTMLLHLGAVRGVNTTMTALLGADKGFDCMSGEDYSASLLRFLDRLEVTASLPRIILFNLNPKDNDLVATITSCFQGGIKGKIQIGPAWWFNSNKNGMERQLASLANKGVLPLFAGMVTGSRSFLSYTRHEYFRRVLCNFIGNLVENGEYPEDFGKLEEIVKNIAYYNAREYFK
jgi:glucuronate isomerase